MGAYIITNNELVAIANAIRQKLSSSDRYFLNNMPAAIASIGTETGSGAVVVEGNETKYLVNETKIKAIADAVRAKNGESTKYLLNQLPQAILDIETSPPVEIAEISDSWDQIIANIDNGTYSTRYKIGNYKPLDLGTEGIINMQIVAMDTDELESGGTAPLTFLGMELLATTRKFSTINWSTNTNIRGYLNDTLLSTIASNVRSRIQTVKKYTRENNNIQTLSNDKLWIPSGKEVGGIGFREDNAKYYNVFFTNNTSRIKRRYGESASESWWLRTYCSGRSTRDFVAGVNSSGVVSDSTSADDRKYNVTSSYGICLGFCLGLASQSN